MDSTEEPTGRVVTAKTDCFWAYDGMRGPTCIHNDNMFNRCYIGCPNYKQGTEQIPYGDR